MFHLTYEAPDSEPGPGEWGQFKHEVAVDQYGCCRDKGHTGRHVGQSPPTLWLL